MTVVSVRGLRKNFTVKTKLPGLSGSLRAVLRPEIHTVEAVKGISLDLEKGELLAFIGPNGAGKSTTIKMLTGILYPTAGQAQVLGYVPWRQRRQLAYHIGSVFGQRFTSSPRYTNWTLTPFGSAWISWWPPSKSVTCSTPPCASSPWASG